MGTASNDFELFRKFLAGERVEVLIQSDDHARLLLSTPEEAPDDLRIALVDVAPDLKDGLRRRFPHAKVEPLRSRDMPRGGP
jgi:hypothetical protein